MRFTDHVVLVTGGGTGIGAATARRFAEEGAAVVITGRRREKLDAVVADLERTRASLASGTGSIEARELDVSDRAAVADLVSTVAADHGKLNVLVNNAGVGGGGTIETGSVEDYDIAMTTNVDGVFFTSRAAVPHLAKTNGSIINLSSASGIGGDWGQAAYTASKGAVTNLTKSMALDLGSQSIRVNAVAPSRTLTGMTEGMTDGLVARFGDRMAIGNGARPEQVASVIAFLASDDASYVTGAIIPVDGGLSASNGQPRLG